MMSFVWLRLACMKKVCLKVLRLCHIAGIYIRLLPPCALLRVPNYRYVLEELRSSECEYVERLRILAEVSKDTDPLFHAIVNH